MYSVYWTLKPVTFILSLKGHVQREISVRFGIYSFHLNSNFKHIPHRMEWKAMTHLVIWAIFIKKILSHFHTVYAPHQTLARCHQEGNCCMAWQCFSPDKPIKYVCLFGVFHPTWPLEDFSLIWRRHHYQWKAAKFVICSALMAVEQWGISSVPHLLWSGTRESA